MGFVALNSHVALWIVDDNITQVKKAGKHARAFSIFIKLIIGLCHLFCGSVKPLYYDHPCHYSSSLHMPLCIFLYTCKVILVITTVARANIY